MNVKVALADGQGVIRALTEAFSIERDADQLVSLLQRLGRDIGGSTGRHAVTMTAELSQRFRSKSEGVGFVLTALEQAFPGASLHVLDTAGHFCSPVDARARPLDVSASNWMATALVVAREQGDAILVDMGSTTTDIIPIASGRVRARGRTDPDRLASGELVYSGALRTPVEALVREVPWRDGHALVSADDFAHTADVHRWLGTLPDEAFDSTGRHATREQAGERLARVVCADRSMLDDAGITAIARTVAEAQVTAVAAAISRVRDRHAGLSRAAILGLGAPIASLAAAAAGLQPIAMDATWDRAASRAAPAAAVARLLEDLDA